MPDKEWIKTLEDGRIVKFANRELLEDEAFITAQVAGNKVVYSIILTKLKNPLSCEEVEDHFEGELRRSSTPQLAHGPITGDLIKPIGEGLAVNPEFKSAIAFILDNEDILAS